MQKVKAAQSRRKERPGRELTNSSDRLAGEVPLLGVHIGPPQTFADRRHTAQVPGLDRPGGAEANETAMAA